MIAANYRKHPQAIAMQRPLPFPRRLVWALPRPTTRALRAIRIGRLAAAALVGRIVHPVKAITPQWFKDAAKRARDLGRQVKAACLTIAEATVHQETRGEKGRRLRAMTKARTWPTNAKAMIYEQTMQQLETRHYHLLRSQMHSLFRKPHGRWVSMNGRPGDDLARSYLMAEERRA